SIFYCSGILHFFFFFQAEDGIRDFHVTGVQTCALPISQNILEKAVHGVGGLRRSRPAPPRRAPRPAPPRRAAPPPRASRPRDVTDRKSVVEGNHVDTGKRSTLITRVIRILW